MATGETNRTPITLKIDQELKTTLTRLSGNEGGPSSSRTRPSGVAVEGPAKTPDHPACTNLTKPLQTLIETRVGGAS